MAVISLQDNWNRNMVKPRAADKPKIMNLYNERVIVKKEKKGSFV